MEGRRPVGVLLLVPPYNGEGQFMLREEWIRLADKASLVLLAPTFKTTPEEIALRRGYYYPEQGSGRATEAALGKLQDVEGVRVDRILIFGFSAGAHFAHRFAAWKPERVLAFAAGGAAWWDEPMETLGDVPALIFCGEEDPRLEACRKYFLAGRVRDFPWIWRSYEGVGHSIPDAAVRLVQAFFETCLNPPRDEPPIYGDSQTYEVSSVADDIAEAVRIRLPSSQCAEAWKQER